MEGHTVSQFIKNPIFKTKLDGMIKYVDIREGIHEAPDLIICEMQGTEEVIKALRAQGLKVIGGHEWANRLKYDAAFTEKAMESFGIKTISSSQYPNLEGPDVTTTVWYADGKPLAQPYSTFETSRFMPWDVGVKTDCQTSVTFGYPKREPKLIQQSFKKMNILMDRMKYTGPLSIDGKVKKGKFYVSCLDTSFAQTSIYGMLQLLDEPIGDFLCRIANGDSSVMKFKEGYAYTLKVSIPPYPGAVSTGALNVKVEGLSPMDWKEAVIPTGVCYIKGEMFTASPDGVVLECLGQSTDLFTAEKIAFETFKKIRLTNKQARLGDGAKTAQRRMNALAKQGYEMPPFEVPVKREYTDLRQEQLVTIAS